MEHDDTASDDRAGTAGTVPTAADDGRTRTTAPMGPIARSHVVRGLLVALVGSLVAFGIPLVAF